MKKIKIIENPKSGMNYSAIIPKKLNIISNILLDRGYYLHKFMTKGKYDATNETMRSCEEDWDAIIVCGGDGTVNEVSCGIAKSERKIPVAILAEGSVNDFASIVGLPTDPTEFCNMMDDWQTVKVDLGKIEDKYFMNVGACGFLTNVAHITPRQIKNILGRTAYFVEGLKEIPKQISKSTVVKIFSEEYTSLEPEEILMFLISNSASVGGFKNLVPTANVSDGYLDCIIVKRTQEFPVILDTLFKFLSGNHTESPIINHFKTKKIKIEYLEGDHIDIDIDGEYAGKLPATFEVVPEAFEIFTVKDK